MASERAGNDIVVEVRRALKRGLMIKPGSGLVVGVSGGPDSVALLHILHELKEQLGYWITVAHLDHGLRLDSAEDALFVREMGRKLGVPVNIERADVLSLAAGQGMSVEEAGRAARYALFEKVRLSSGAEATATAHHLDDSIETFFLRLLRGSTFRGLRGIPAMRDSIIRPLIRVERQQILGFLNERNLPFRIDPTNLNSDTDRNFIRNRLFPTMEERFPYFRVPLERTLEMIGAEDRYLDELARELSSRTLRREEDRVILDRVQLLAAPRVLAARVLVAALYETSGSVSRWTRAHVEMAFKIMRDPNPGASADLASGVVLRREYDNIILSTRREEETLADLSLAVTGPGRFEWPYGPMVLDFQLVERDIINDLSGLGADEALFDADEASFPLEIRCPRPGDRLRPWGMEGTRKLKNLLIDLKIPRRLRHGLPLLLKGDEILWIPGIRRGRAAGVTPATKKVLKARAIRHEVGRIE